MSMTSTHYNLIHRNGYPSFANWIARDTDSEIFVFRRFARLSARNVLHLQSQLYELETKLDILDQTLQGQPASNRLPLWRWESFVVEYGDPADASVSTRYENAQLVLDIQNKLKEYRESLY